MLGSWPAACADVEAGDVVVSNAVYGGRDRPALEGDPRPRPATRRVADDLQGVLVNLGVTAEREAAVVPARARDLSPAGVAFMRRLMVGEESDAKIAELMRTLPRSARVRVALWWPGCA